MMILQINRMGLARISNLFLPACHKIDNIVNPANSQNRYFRYQLEFVYITHEDFQKKIAINATMALSQQTNTGRIISNVQILHSRLRNCPLQTGCIL